jgi:hypothetical protein
MALLTVGKAAELVGKTRQALYRKIKVGELSVSVGHDNVQVVDTSELLRVFGTLQLEGGTDSQKLSANGDNRTAHKTLKKDSDRFDSAAVGQALELGELRASTKYLERMLEAAEERALSAEARAASAEARAIEAMTMNQRLLVDLQAVAQPRQEDGKKGKRKSSVIK